MVVCIIMHVPHILYTHTHSHYSFAQCKTFKLKYNVMRYKIHDQGTEDILWDVDKKDKHFFCTYINDDGTFLLEALHDGRLRLADVSLADKQVRGITGRKARLSDELSNETGGTDDENPVLLSNNGYNHR